LIEIGEMHPNYVFDSSIKNSKYNLILKSLKGPVYRALTLPGLANYTFERMLEAEHPKVETFCFELDKKIYNNIKKSFHEPRSVLLFNQDVESFMINKNFTYNLIWLDYCGGPHGQISGLVNDYLAPNGIFAITQYYGRGHKYPPIVRSNFEKVIETIHYNHMLFDIYRKQ
jgi:hypothetical protein